MCIFKPWINDKTCNEEFDVSSEGPYRVLKTRSQRSRKKRTWNLAEIYLFSVRLHATGRVQDRFG